MNGRTEYRVVAPGVGQHGILHSTPQQALHALRFAPPYSWIEQRTATPWMPARDTNEPKESSDGWRETEEVFQALKKIRKARKKYCAENGINFP